MKTVILSLSLLWGSQAIGAESLYCNFTEPFIKITFDGSTKNITKVSPEDWNEETGNFDPQNLGPGVLVRLGEPDAFPPAYELRDQQGTAILKLVFDGQGSDGMSDNTYPISAEYMGFSGLMGGCHTDSATPWNPFQIEASLGLTTP